METLPIEGFSVAGIETSIVVPTLKVVLDMGRCSSAAVSHSTVLVSHGHLDHAGALSLCGAVCAQGRPPDS
jgi:mRNA degradation ribonuclease J1/J2